MGDRRDMDVTTHEFTPALHRFADRVITEDLAR